MWTLAERSAIAERRAIDPHEGIDFLEPVLINGLPQWIQIRGRNSANPVILFVHGGPGNTWIPYAHLYQDPWEEHFTVVHWDQRGAGKSSRRPKTGEKIPFPTDLNELVNDGLAVVDFVLSKLGKRKLILVGHSFGSLIGTEMIRRAPSRFYAYVGTGQLVDGFEQEREGYAFALKHAEANDRRDDIESLESIAPYPETVVGASSAKARLDVIVRQRSILSRAGGLFYTPSPYGYPRALISATFLSPDYTLAEAWQRLRAGSDISWMDSALGVASFTSRFRAEDWQFELPVYFYLGRNDYVTSSVTVERFREQMSAPVLRLRWFERSAHFPMLEEPQKFLDALLEDVSPLATDRPTP